MGRGSLGNVRQVPLAVSAVSKWASVGIAKVDVAADVDVAAEARSAVVRKAGTRGHLG
jgi:hypothetical protein